MKIKSFIFAILFLASFATLQAQATKKAKMSPEQRVDRQTEQMASQLSLSDEQKAKVKVVNEKYAKQMQDLRANTEDRTQLRPKMQEMRQAQEKEISQYLTKEQTEKWAQIKNEKKDRRAEMQKGQRAEKMRPNREAMAGKRAAHQSRSPQEKAAKRTEKMTKELGLSPEQAKKIEAIYVTSGEKKANYQGAKNSESRENMKKWREEENKAVDAILTKEQIAKRDELKAQKKAERMERKKGMKKESKKFGNSNDSDDSDN